MDPRVQYALEVLVGPDIDPAEVVSYRHGNDATRLVQIVPSRFFEDTYGTKASLPTLPLRQIEGVPLLFGEPVIQRCGQTLVVKADIVASAYFLLTRYEEWVRRDVRDQHGKFPGRQSLPHRAGFIDRPIVEEYGKLLRKWAGQMGISLPQPKRRFSVLLTHDVDFLTSETKPLQLLRSVGKAVLGRQPWKGALRRVASSLGMASDPLNNFNEIIELDRRIAESGSANRCQSAYFFMAGGETAFDGNYDIRGASAREAIRQVLASRASVGLHASYEAGQRPELVSAERTLLEEVAGVTVSKNRHHYLAWREPEDGRAIASAGIDWDATLGYTDIVGFRLGICRPIPLFDPVHGCLLGIEEHPLIVMDVTLSAAFGMSLDEEAAFRHVSKLADTTAQHQGEFVLLWHNNVLAATGGGYHRRLYPRVLDYLSRLLASDARATTAGNPTAGL